MSSVNGYEPDFVIFGKNADTVKFVHFTNNFLHFVQGITYRTQVRYSFFEPH